MKTEKTKLPDDFRPSPYSIICGRGAVSFNAVGNRRFRVLASTYLQRYSEAHTKFEKSCIVSDIVRTIREACPVGAFVKQEKGCWWEVADDIAREKVGAYLRDSLHDQYRSSAKAKVAKRKERKQGGKTTAEPDESTSLEPGFGIEGYEPPSIQGLAFQPLADTRELPAFKPYEPPSSQGITFLPLADPRHLHRNDCPPLPDLEHPSLFPNPNFSVPAPSPPSRDQAQSQPMSQLYWNLFTKSK